MGAKARCSNCKNYQDRDTMLRTSLGLGGICSESCLNEYLQKRRDKQARRREHRALKSSPTSGGGRRLPGTCRDRVRRRDKGKCRWCGTTEDLQIHHVRYRSEGGPDTPRNLLTLCASCHERAHSNKRKYQQVLLLWLWIYYEQEREVSMASTFRTARAHADWVESARAFSNAVLQENEKRSEKVSDARV